MTTPILSLRDELHVASPVLAEAVERSWVIAREEWLPALGVSNESFNSYPHLRNVEEQATLIVRGFEEVHPRVGSMLDPVEMYLLLTGCLMHDIGRIIDNEKLGHGAFSAELILRDYAVLGIPSRDLAHSLAKICEYHEPMVGDNKQTVRWKFRILTIAPYGTVRELLLATLLALADTMDGAFTRVLPWYLHSPVRGLQPVGAFRNLVRGVYLDARRRMVKTVLGEVSVMEPDPATYRLEYNVECSKAIEECCTETMPTRYAGARKCEKSKYGQQIPEVVILDCCRDPLGMSEHLACPHLSALCRRPPATVALTASLPYWRHEQAQLLEYTAELAQMTDDSIPPTFPAVLRKTASRRNFLTENLIALCEFYDNKFNNSDQAKEKTYALWREWTTNRIIPCLRRAICDADSADWLPEMMQAARQLLFHLVKFAICCREVTCQDKLNCLSSPTATDYRQTSCGQLSRLKTALKAWRHPFHDYPLLRRYLADRRLLLYNEVVSNRQKLREKVSGDETPVEPRLPRAFHAAHWLAAARLLSVGQPEKMEAQWPTAALLAKVLSDVTRNKDTLREIGTDLVECGIPVYAWLVEYRECLYTHSGQETFEPILSKPMLERVAKGMWDLSRRVFGVEEFSYQMLADHLYESDVERVKIAVRRLAVVTRHLRRQLVDGYNIFIAQDSSSDPGPVILCNGTTWRWVVENLRARRDDGAGAFVCCLLTKDYQIGCDLQDERCLRCTEVDERTNRKHCQLATIIEVMKAISELVEPV